MITSISITSRAQFGTTFAQVDITNLSPQPSSALPPGQSNGSTGEYPGLWNGGGNIYI